MVRRRSLVALVLMAGLAACGGGAGSPASESSVTPSASSAGKTITAEEVAKHNSAESCWTVIDYTVYDVTAWISQHPGGPDKIEGICGDDGTEEFMGQHEKSPKPNERLKEFAIGQLDSGEDPGASQNG